jgi:hypothetical protein
MVDLVDTTDLRKIHSGELGLRISMAMRQVHEDNMAHMNSGGFPDFTLMKQRGLNAHRAVLVQWNAEQLAQK